MLRFSIVLLIRLASALASSTRPFRISLFFRRSFAFRLAVIRGGIELAPFLEEEEGSFAKYNVNPNPIVIHAVVR